LENVPASCRGAEVGFCGANGGGGLDGDEDAMDRGPAERGGDRDLRKEGKGGRGERKGGRILCRGVRGSVSDTRPRPSDATVVHAARHDRGLSLLLESVWGCPKNICRIHLHLINDRILFELSAERQKSEAQINSEFLIQLL